MLSNGYVGPTRDSRAQDLAVGSKGYVAKVKSALGAAAKHRAVVVDNGIHALKEPVISYMVYFGH